MMGDKSVLKKALWATGLTLTAIHAVNRLVDANARVKLSKKKQNNSGIRTYETQYGAVRYKKSGKGEPLLLLHGLHSPMGLDEWEKNTATLSKRYTVYSLEFLGYGYSKKPHVSYSAYLLASLVNDFIRNVIGRRSFVAVSGESCGVCVAASLLEPGLFKKILLISPMGTGSRRLSPKAFRKRFFELPILGTALYNIMNSKQITKYLLKTVYFDKNAVSSELSENCYQSAHYEPEGAKCAYAATLSNYFNVDLERMIEKTAVPIHVIWGDGNILNPFRNCAGFVSESERIFVTVFEGTKVYPHYENPSAFHKVCLWFFR